MDRNGEVWRNHDNMMMNQLSDHQEDMEFRKGSWTAEEDQVLANYVAVHGEGRWNALAQCAGLNRTGKSCRLRWLNYLRPDVIRGDITLEEQLLILELHCRWGNRWSKIAQHLPGRTDNEIKNYWRTRVQKHAKQLKCDVNSKQFKDALRNVWMPRLVEKIEAARGSRGTGNLTTSGSTSTTYQNTTNLDMGYNQMVQMPQPNICNVGINTYTSENSSVVVSSESLNTVESDVTDCLNNYAVHHGPGNDQNCFQAVTNDQHGYADISQNIGDVNQWSDFTEQNSQWMNGGDLVSDILWDVDDLWLLQQQFNIHDL